MNLRLKLEQVSKSYGGLDVLKELSQEFTAPGIYCLTAPSGAGKTTLFRLIMGLEKPDSGTICFFDDSVHRPREPFFRSADSVSHSADLVSHSAVSVSPSADLVSHSGDLIHRAEDSIRFSSVFQEDRLIEHLSPIENTALVLLGKADSAAIRRELSCLLPEESLDRPVCTLSGGMRRRCAFLRAMMAVSDIVIMDEPFTGLDNDTKNIVIDYLLAHQNNRLFLIATHDPSDIEKLGAVTLKV